MSQFIQIHMLTSYPPACLNRDDLNRPKTAKMGGKLRLRISSQCLKRTWRTSEMFREALGGQIGTRTKEMGAAIYHSLIKGVSLEHALEGVLDAVPVRPAVDEKKAAEWARSIVAKFGSPEGESKTDPLQGLRLKQLAHFMPEEVEAIAQLLNALSDTAREEGPGDEELSLLQKKSRAVDIAMFGRMLADAPAYNAEAAVQVAHAVSVHEIAVEDDYFTAVDDLNRGEEDRGSAHIGETEFGAGVFYSYICINKDLLVENLQDDEALAAKALKALVAVCAKVAPSGKQNSFASRARADYVLAERGEEQPRSLAVAFLDPVRNGDFLTEAVAAIRKTRSQIDKVYGPCANESVEMCRPEEKGSMEDVLNFVAGA